MDDVTRFDTDLAALPVMRTLQAEVNTILAETDYAIFDAVGYRRAAETLGRVKSAIKQIEEQRVAITKPINEALRTINAQAKVAADPWQNVERKIKGAIAAYDAEQDRIRREAQRVADEAARKEREKLERQAAAAAAKGKEDKAVELEQRAAAVVSAVAQPETPKVEGVSRRFVVKTEVTDPKLVPREYCKPDEPKIDKIAKAMGGDIEIPGVRIWKEAVISARAAG